MPSGYTHLTRDHRSQIYILRKTGTSHRMIAAQLGVCQSTISREIRRNSGKRGYRFQQAQEKADLRRRGKKPNWKGGRHSGRGHIPERRDISKRPAVVDAKVRVGDWEADTIIGAGHSGALVSAADRVSWMTFLRRVDARTAEAVGEMLRDCLEPCRELVLTLTADNGREFAGHADVSAALGAEVYFAHPYRSCDRGLNEHVNRLVREYFPKGTDFRRVTDAEVRAVQDRLNGRPRKVLGYRTPEEVFGEVLHLSRAA